MTFNSEDVTPQEQLDFITKAFTENKKLTKEYQSVKITHSNNLSSFVPQPFFKEEDLQSYLNYNLKVLQNDFIAFDTIKNAEMVNVYIPFVHLNNFLFENFGNFEYKHSSSVLVDVLLKQSSNSDPLSFYVNVENDFFQIIVIKRKKLILYNAFNFKTAQDFIYHMLFTAEQLHLNPDKFQLTLLGEIEKESELYDIAYKYVRHINFFESDTNSGHANFVLLNQY